MRLVSRTELNRDCAEDAHTVLAGYGKMEGMQSSPNHWESGAIPNLPGIRLNDSAYHTVTTKKVRVMAVIRKLEKITLDKDSTHTETDATYSIVQSEGESYLQIDTYGSKDRKMEGKKSQSIRLSTEAIDQLQSIIKKNKLGSH